MNFGNVWRRAVVKFNQMSGEKLEMSGEAQNNFAYSVGLMSPLCKLDSWAQKHREIMCCFPSVEANVHTLHRPVMATFQEF